MGKAAVAMMRKSVNSAPVMSASRLVLDVEFQVLDALVTGLRTSLESIDEVEVRPFAVLVCLQQRPGQPRKADHPRLLRFSLQGGGDVRHRIRPTYPSQLSSLGAKGGDR